MNMFAEVPAVLLPQLDALSQMDVGEYRAELGLTADRVKVLDEILKGKKRVEYFAALDIHLFCLKKLFPDQYRAAPVLEHLYSQCDLFEFDPPKNGQNLIKHGIAFGEVANFSRGFGTLMVPCPDKADGERFAIFSDLTIDSGHHLSAPLSSIDFTNEIYTLSVVSHRNERFRFISSRTFSRKSYREVVSQSFKGIYDDDRIKKSRFTLRCYEILEHELFKPNPTSASSSTASSFLRVVRPVS